MSKVLTPESVATRPDASYFSPERLALLKRIFESVCNEENIVSKQHRDDLAVKLLTAGKNTDDEGILIAVMKESIAGYQK